MPSRLAVGLVLAALAASARLPAAEAADVPSPAVQAVLDEYRRANADAAQKAIAKLRKLQDAETRKGDLEAALRVRKAMETFQRILETSADDLLGDAPDQKLAIASARYGVDKSWIDATAWLRGRLKDGKVEPFPVARLWSTIGDPAPGVSKVLEVEYVVLGRAKKRVFANGENVELP